MLAVSHRGHVCCAIQQTCLLCHTADMSTVSHSRLSAVSHRRHICCVTQLKPTQRNNFLFGLPRTAEKLTGSPEASCSWCARNAFAEIEVRLLAICTTEANTTHTSVALRASDAARVVGRWLRAIFTWITRNLPLNLRCHVVNALQTRTLPLKRLRCPFTAFSATYLTK